jgi:F-type H+-transporting ATPase subunit delta
VVKDLLAARRYALALFEIARETHQDETLEAELESLSAAMKADPSIERFLSNPGLELEDKKKFLGRLYQERNHEIYEILLNFFLVLFEKGRFYLIHDISTEFKRIADEAQGQGTAEIRSASALKPEAQRAIVSRLEAIAGYKITVKSIVDPALIGGVMVKVRNKIIDDTVANKIFTMKKALTKVQSI